MMPNILNMEPKLVWKQFDEIRKIPRCSKHEEKIREYIVGFGKKQGLDVKVDDVGNVCIRKPASPGMENKPIVILQGHMDMVCEKNSDVDHDFSKDPINIKIDGDILMAEGTTLGADNGIGMALSLAVLEDPNVKHGPLEVLMTVDEETGLTGAFAMKSDMLTGKIMLNLDSEDFGVLTVGCAGGGDSTITLPLKTQKPPAGAESMLVKVSGLRGGHSGVDIHEQRGNAIKLLARMLWKTKQTTLFFLHDINGGDKHNAIPREATAKLCIQPKDKETFISSMEKEKQHILEEMQSIDPKFTISIKSCEQPKSVFDDSSQSMLLNLLQGLPHGVHKMNYDIPTLVETSTNLATISVKDSSVVVGMSSRSPMKSALQDMRDRIRAIAVLSGATVKEGSSYPGWKPNLDSKILKLAKTLFNDLFEYVPKIEAIHAGLECGIIGEKFPGMDMISIGPTIKNPHSPEELVHISTVDKTYKFLIKILENV